MPSSTTHTGRQLAGRSSPRTTVSAATIDGAAPAGPVRTVASAVSSSGRRSVRLLDTTAVFGAVRPSGRPTISTVTATRFVDSGASVSNEHRTSWPITAHRPPSPVVADTGRAIDGTMSLNTTS